MPLSAQVSGPLRQAVRRSRFVRMGAARCGALQWAAFGLLIILLVPATPGIAQVIPGSDPAPAAAQPSTDSSTTMSGLMSDDSDGARIGQDAAANGDDLSAQQPLSSDQIIAILQQNPDLTTELKAQLADRMQQQGMQVDPDSISDQELYKEISTNASLRASVSEVLRARGFATNSLPSPGASVSNSASSFGRDDTDSVSTTDGLLMHQQSSSARTRPSPMFRDGLGQQDSRRREERTNASTDLPQVQRQPPPYDLQALRDLYAQFPDEAAPLRRFGAEVFIRRVVPAAGRGVSARDTPLDVPLGPDYVVGSGDVLTIELWGGLTQSITRTIDRDGRIFLPEAGPLQVAGLPLAKVQSLVEGALRRQFRDAQVAVTVSGLRSVRVYAVGDVQRPGGYDISALATPLSLLYAAGGPTAAGSLRTFLHYRGKQLIEKIDLYDFLLHGVRNGTVSFQSGDTLVVPPAGRQVAVLGAVRRPAIYELSDEENTLAAVIEDAGGFTAAASLSHIRIERIDANRQRETVTLSERADTGADGAQHALAAFRVQDGDRIQVEPILPYSQRAVYLAGHVVRPGRLPYTDGLRLTNVLRSYRDMLPEPADRGEIIRLVAPDLHPETINFSVPEVLIGHADIDLRPFDTIRILGRYQADAPSVSIRGEVLRPGTYPLAKDMTAARLVRMAGGFRRDAVRESADLTSYEVKNGDRVVEALSTVRIGDAVDGTDPKADVILKSGDVLAIHQITNWSDIGQSITISGQVRFPGSYGFRDGERLSSVLRRAGGLLSTAYPAGAVLERQQVRDLEQQSRDELIRQIQTNSASARLSPSATGSNAAGVLQLIQAQQEQVLTDLKAHPPSGRMVIHVTADIDRWANTTADIELRQGDVLTIPKHPGFVLVTGQVYNATALTFVPGKTAEWYLSRAGGTNSTANRKEIFIIRANGSVVGRRSGEWLGGDVLSTKLDPGDVVVVPQKIIGGSLFWRNLLSTGQLAASVAITAGVASAAL